MRGSAQVHSEEFQACVALMAQHVYDRFGKFPGTVPSIFILTYLQAHHLDLDFYDHHFQAGAYLRTHARAADPLAVRSRRPLQHQAGVRLGGLQGPRDRDL